MMEAPCSRLLDELKQEIDRMQARSQELAAENDELSQQLNRYINGGGNEEALRIPEVKPSVIEETPQVVRVVEPAKLEINGAWDEVQAPQRLSEANEQKADKRSVEFEAEELPHYRPSDALAASVSVSYPLTQAEAFAKLKTCGSRLSLGHQVRNERELGDEFLHLIRARGKDALSAEDLYAMSVEMKANTFWKKSMGLKLQQKLVLSQYRSALRAFNEGLQTLDSQGIKVRHIESSSPAQLEQMHVETYVAMFDDQEHTISILESSMGLGRDIMHSLQQISQVIINHSMLSAISAETNVGLDCLQNHRPKTSSEFFASVLDAVAGVLIMCNVITLTLSLDVDPDWPGWPRIDNAFTFVFLIEIGIRWCMAGNLEHLFGDDCWWNYFDMFVMFLSLVDILLSAVSTAEVSAFRIIRVVRMGKMVRVLRIKALKELRIIINGLIGGLRTIVWAFFFLFFFILVLAIISKPVLSQPAPDINCEELPWGCENARRHLADRDRSQLFGTVWRCMFTLFRCFVGDGCDTTSGIPLMPILWDMYGGFLLVGYVVCFLFLTFGLFNLIMATIVESTMSAGKADESKRRRALRKEKFRVSHIVKKLVHVLCQEEEDQEEQSFFQSMSFKQKKKSYQGESMMKSRITSQEFAHKLDMPYVRKLLDQLDISTTHPQNYIEAFDANEDGILSVVELVTGLMKLRGNVEKSDIVAILMASRDMQRSLQSLEGTLSKNHKLLSTDRSIDVPSAAGGGSFAI